ncbi:hypothetical protein QWY31_14325 [Cytophagales bacterium LB-30]|uniref:RHS repeat protein n=1 Tax=Shiella aurantiaca TaxID=3058365 RepID=A0ABT8F8S9_9BACT|nr:hypothetical protein [Shiella aurantiaca]MDN4166683.1 hypothetical protein [Shiella aurantiaca]
MRLLLISLGLFINAYQSHGQEINVRDEIYPGVTKIIVKSVGHGIHRLIRSPHNGYRGEYLLDDNGRAKKETRFKRREHLATYEYEFLENGLLSKQTTTFDINNPKRIHSIYYHYEIKEDHVINEICYTANDTLYRVDNIEFNDKGQRTVYIRNVNESKNYLTYDNGYLKNWKSIDFKDSVERMYEFGYDENGNLTKFDFSQVPEPEMKEVWLHVYGDGNHRNYKYKYDKSGRWIKKYQIVDRKKILLEKRRYVM